jgi:DNA-binding transcriptional regulator YhcF (GntR family)
LKKDSPIYIQILNAIKKRKQFPTSDAAIDRKFPSAEASTAILNVNTDYTAAISLEYLSSDTIKEHLQNNDRKQILYLLVTKPKRHQPI